MEKEKLQLLKQLIQKEVSIDQAKDTLELNELEIMGMINLLRKDGSNIITSRRNNLIYVIDRGDDTLINNSKYYLNLDDKRHINKKQLKLCFISDTRLCSKYQQLSILNDIYKKAYDFGVTDVIHCGDISEGVYSSTNLYYESIFNHDVSSQSKYIIEHYPCIDSIVTHFITGEHDLTHIKTEKTDIGKLIDNEREDLNYLGQKRKKIIIVDDKKEILSILALHPKGKIPYTISYKPQQFINAMRSEDKTDMLLHGHWLQTERLNYRGVEEYSVPGVIKTTPEMVDRGDQNTIGAWFVTISLNNQHKVEDIRPIFLPYYQTIEDDYKTAKVLKLGVK